jgi:hypothetical protein
LCVRLPLSQIFTMAPPCDWWRKDHFTDHPRYKDKDPISWASNDGKRAKVACRVCWATAIQKCLGDDQKEVAEGQRASVRSVQMIEEQSEHTIYSRLQYLLVLAVWASAIGDTTREWIQSRPETLLRHLANKCPLQPQAIRDAARQECETRNYSISSPKIKRTISMMNLTPSLSPQVDKGGEGTSPG